MSSRIQHLLDAASSVHSQNLATSQANVAQANQTAQTIAMQPNETAVKQNKMVLIVLAIVVVLAFLLILKKKK